MIRKFLVLVEVIQVNIIVANLMLVTRKGSDFDVATSYTI